LERLVKFDVLGQEYPLYTDAPEEDVQEILNLVKSQLEAYSRVSSTLPPNKVAILASLNMAGKYVKLKKDFEQLKKNVKDSTEKLRIKIDSTVK
jgi:cell division protein ZapA